jgi:anti-anti-sigma factor
MHSASMMITEVQGVTVAALRVASILDGPMIEGLKRQLFELVEEQNRQKLVVDFHGVSFLASQMLGVLVSLHKKCEEIDGHLVLVGMKPSLMKVFKIMKLNKVLHFAKDESTAVSMMEKLG